jgi:hypothetical protein
MPNLSDIEYGYRSPPDPGDNAIINNDETSFAQIMMQKLATQLLGFMASCGSPIRVYSSGHCVALPDSRKPAPDSNGHQWPEYTYIRGKVTDVLAKESVVAVPLTNADLEMPEDPVLLQRTRRD